MDVTSTFRQLRNRIMGMVRRGVVGSQASDGTLQVATVADRTVDRVEMFEQYGFASNPPSNAECLVFQVGADASHNIAIACGDRTVRVAIESGEVAVYHPDGASIVLRTGGAVEVNAAPGQPIVLGGDATATVTHAAISENVRAFLIQTLNAGAPVANDGGAALRTAQVAFLTASDPNPVGAENVLVQP